MKNLTGVRAELRRRAVPRIFRLVILQLRVSCLVRATEAVHASGHLSVAKLS